MKDQQQQQQAQNTAITSGAAMGAATGGTVGPTGPAAQNQWDGSGLGGKGLTEAGIFKEKEFGKGFSLQVLTGALGPLDGARGNSVLQKLFDAFEGKDGWFKNTMGGGNQSGSGGGEGGGSGGSNHAYSAVGGAAAGAAMGGMTGGGNVPMSSLGNLSPSTGGVGGRSQSGPGL